MRDLRDPHKLGSLLTETKKKTERTSQAYDRLYRDMQAIPAWQDDGHMSSNPAEHHSKTPQSADPNDWPDAL